MSNGTENSERQSLQEIAAEIIIVTERKINYSKITYKHYLSV